MSLSATMREVESHGFAARVNLSSDLKTFLRAAENEPAVRALFDEMASRDNMANILSRVAEIAQSRVDPRYENPYDVALAIYVWAMSFIDLSFAKVAAQAVEQASNCWWSKQLATQILTTGYIRSTTFDMMPVLAHQATMTSHHPENLIPSGGLVFTGGAGTLAGTWIGTTGTTFQGNLQDTGAGEMVIPLGFFVDTNYIGTASISEGSPEGANTENGWLGTNRPIYTTATDDPHLLAA